MKKNKDPNKNMSIYKPPRSSIKHKRIMMGVRVPEDVWLDMKKFFSICSDSQQEYGSQNVFIINAIRDHLKKIKRKSFPFLKLLKKANEEWNYGHGNS